MNDNDTPAYTASYVPTEELTTSLAYWKWTVEEERRARKAVRGVVAADMEKFMVSDSEMAEHVPWTSETIRKIAHEYGVPTGRRRKLTSIRSKLSRMEDNP